MDIIRNIAWLYYLLWIAAAGIVFAWIAADFLIGALGWPENWDEAN